MPPTPARRPRRPLLVLAVGTLPACELDASKDAPDGDAGQSGGTDWSLYTDTGDTGDTSDALEPESPSSDPSADPYGRDLDCPQPTECISLAESVDRGWSSIVWNGTLDVDNRGPYPICTGRWHTFFSETSQDAIAGHSDVVWPGEAEDAFELSPTQTWEHEYAATAGSPAWWCIERTQVTAAGSAYRFTGARAPTPLMSWVHTESDTNGNGVVDQVDFADPSTGAPWTNHNIWDHIAEQPVYVVGRTPNYLELRPGNSAPLTVEVVNLGRSGSSIQVRERLPAGARAWGFSVQPTTSETHTDGSSTHTWYFKMNGAEDDEDISQPSTYDIVQIDYNIEWTGTDCGYREETWAPEVEWLDLDGLRQVSYGTELILACCERD